MSETPIDDPREVKNLNFNLANYFSCSLVPKLFIDADLVLRTFSPPAMAQFNLKVSHTDKNIHEIIDHFELPDFLDDLKEVISEKFSLEKEVQTTDGKWFQMSLILYTEQGNDQVIGIIITFIDITKRFNAIKELEKLNASHETLMFALSHDLKQPVSAITLLADALAQAYKKNDEQQFHKWIQTLKQSSRNLTSLIDDFTGHHEDRTGNGSAVMPLNIKDICEDVIIALKTEIRSNNISIKKNFQITEIEFPRNNFRSIIYNLLHNAIKYRDLKKSTKIELSTKQIDGYVVLTVKDNGPGIAEEHQLDVFEKSVRIREDIKGTGMGLYIAKKMVEANDGKIILESMVGKGSVFKVYFKSEFSNQPAEENSHISQTFF